MGKTQISKEIQLGKNSKIDKGRASFYPGDIPLLRKFIGGHLALNVTIGEEDEKETYIVGVNVVDNGGISTRLYVAQPFLDIVDPGFSAWVPPHGKENRVPCILNWTQPWGEYENEHALDSFGSSVEPKNMALEPIAVTTNCEDKPKTSIDQLEEALHLFEKYPNDALMQLRMIKFTRQAIEDARRG